jgi:hypothetical protein
MNSRALLVAGALLALCLAPGPSLGAGDTVQATPVSLFRNAPVGGKVDGLIWRGGLQLESRSDLFGGLSGIGFLGPDNHLVMVSDHGSFVSGQLVYDDQSRPLSFVGATIELMKNSKGADLPRAYARDAEAVAVIERNGVASAVRIGFENLTRVSDYKLAGNVPGGPAAEIPIPDWLAKLRNNQSLEAVCIAPPASPIAGSTLLITESALDAEGNHSAWLLGKSHAGGLSLTPKTDVSPTDCAFLPNGDLLVLERGMVLFSFTMTLRRFPAAEVRSGAIMQGETLLTATGGDIDNMEGVAVHKAPDGGTRITLISDNNFNDWERSLLLEFSLPE